MGKSGLTCDCEVIHEENVTEVQKRLPSDEFLADLSDFFKIFADSTRVKILCSLDNSELCVCDISAILNMTISAVSHQLKILRDANLVKNHRKGKEIYYSLSDNHVREIIECGLEHILEKKDEE